MKVTAEPNSIGILLPRLEPAHEALEIFLAGEMSNSQVGQYFLGGIREALANTGRFGTACNDVSISGDQIQTRIWGDEMVVPNPASGELPTSVFLQALSDWITVLKSHGL